MLHPEHTIDIRRHRAAVLAAFAAGTVAGVTAIGRWRNRELATARAAAAVWRTEALHDPLTGLPNRRAALAEVGHRLAGTRPFLLALLDLDDFKTVNDTYGHPVGDTLLTIVAGRLHLTIPADAYAARLGGDEFLLLLPDHGGDPTDTLTRVLDLLAQPVRIAGATLQPQARAGVATGRRVGWQQLIARADQALYRAKTSDNAVAIYDPHLDTPTTGDGPRRPRIRSRDRQPHRPASAPNAQPEPPPST